MFSLAALWNAVLPYFFYDGPDDTWLGKSDVYLLYWMCIFVFLSVVVSLVVITVNHYGYAAGFVRKPRTTRRCKSVMGRTLPIIPHTPPLQYNEDTVHAMEQGSLGKEEEEVDEESSFLWSDDADTLDAGSDELALSLSDSLVDVVSYCGAQQILDVVSSPRPEFCMVMNETFNQSAHASDSRAGEAVTFLLDDSFICESPQTPHFSSTPAHGLIDLERFLSPEPTSPVGEGVPVTPGSLATDGTFCTGVVTRKCARRLFE